MRTTRDISIGLRARGVAALVAYVLLLCCAHVHPAVEDHHHGDASTRLVDQGHGSEHNHHHGPHPAADHDPADSVPRISKVQSFLTLAPAASVQLLPLPLDAVSHLTGFSIEAPKYPPPRLPEQPRSPPSFQLS